MNDEASEAIGIWGMKEWILSVNMYNCIPSFPTKGQPVINATTTVILPAINGLIIGQLGM